MKHILAIVSLLIATAACSTAPPANKDVTANANKAGAEMKSTGAVSESDIIAKEKAAWDIIKKKDWDGYGKTLAADYLEVLDDGVHDRAASLASIKEFVLSDVTFADWKMLPINKDAVIITYSVTVQASFKGEKIPPGPYREASAYVNRNGEWVAIYYQETLARKAPPPPPSPSPAASQPKKETGQVTLTPVTGPDPVANEKSVWDTFRTRNYPGFASYLDKDFMEIEADAVYDKDGSVKAVTGFDVSKFELSDWKSVKFDDNAALVTYTIKGPGLQSEKEYHSTIWAKRERWLAIFHQGTPAATSAVATPKPEMKKM